MIFDPQSFLLFLAGALLVNVTPGPDMAFTLATSAKGGTRTGVAAALGVGTGSLVWAILTAGGLAALLAASQHAMTAVRICGGAYLVFLAVQTWRKRHEWRSAGGAGGAAAAFRSGALTNLFNPKVGLFYLAFLPAFTNAEFGPVWLQALVLGAVFSVGGACVLTAVAVLAGSARDALARSPSTRSVLNTVSAGVFGVLGLHLIFGRSA